MNETGDKVHDAYNFRPDYDGLSEARLPDGDREFDDATEPTRGAANQKTVNEDVIINEVMFHPIDDNSDREFVELYNRGPTAVDLTGWAFTNGIEFEFPPGTTIGSDRYLVVSAGSRADPRHLRAGRRGDRS